MVAKKTPAKGIAQRKPAPRHKAVKRSHSRKKGKGGLLARCWPMILGGVIVVGACWLLYKVVSQRELESVCEVPRGYTVHGIDISHHQGTVDWELLRNEARIDSFPVSFVFMKATEGVDVFDSQFERNFSQARRYGMMRGAYHFFRPLKSAKQQAEHFIRHVRLEAGDLPPVLDVEVKPDDLSSEAFRQGILEWLVRVEQHYGVKPILYTYHSFRQQYLNDSVFNLYPYWIAHYYVDSVRYRGPWAFWQHRDDGQLTGIRERVDLDVFRGSFEELQQLTIGRK